MANFNGIDWKHLIKVGVNPALATGTLPETIWEGGGVYQFLPTAQVLEIVSSNATDTALGVGARSVTITGLDSSWNQQSETVILNGLTPVLTSKTWWRINGMVVGSAGTTGTNVGNIILRRTGGGITQEYIRAGIGVARSMIYSIPAGHDLLINSLVFGSTDTFTNNNTIICKSKAKNSVTGVQITPAEVKIMTSQTPQYAHKADPFVLYSEKTDYSWEASDINSGNILGVIVYMAACLVNTSFTGTLDVAEYPRW